MPSGAGCWHQLAPAAACRTPLTHAFLAAPPQHLSCRPPLLQIHLGDGTKWATSPAVSHGTVAYLGAWVAVQPGGDTLQLKASGWQGRSCGACCSCFAGACSWWIEYQAAGSLLPSSCMPGSLLTQSGWSAVHRCWLPTAACCRLLTACSQVHDRGAKGLLQCSSGGTVSAAGALRLPSLGAAGAAADAPAGAGSWRHVTLELEGGRATRIAHVLEQRLVQVGEAQDAFEAQIEQAVQRPPARAGPEASRDAEAAAAAVGTPPGAAGATMAEEGTEDATAAAASTGSAAQAASAAGAAGAAAHGAAGAAPAGQAAAAEQAAAAPSRVQAAAARPAAGPAAPAAAATVAPAAPAAANVTAGPLSGPGHESFGDVPADEEAEPESLGAGSVRLHLSWRPLQRPASSLAAAAEEAAAVVAAASRGGAGEERKLQPAPTFIRLLSRRVEVEAEPAEGGQEGAAGAAAVAAEAAAAAEEGRAAQRRKQERSADAVAAGLPVEIALEPLPLHLHAYGHGGGLFGTSSSHAARVDCSGPTRCTCTCPWP